MADASEPTASSLHDDLEAFDMIGRRCDQLRTEMARVLVGQHEAVQTLLMALLCEGHVLIVGVPGLAKTLLVRTLAKTLELKFKRLQFTPDMMPSDILGTELIQEDPATGQRSLRFVPGPIFANLILADEVNRTPPKTQAALLEAMGERQVTTAGRTISLERPFLVVATQNPIEQEGTYPLPEAQLDRFIFSLWMDYPDKQDEIDIVLRTPQIHHETVQTVFPHDLLTRCIRAVQAMPVSRHVVEYAVTLARATRPQDPHAHEMTRQYVAWGAGPRASQYLIHGAQALAAMTGEPTPACEHVKDIAMAVLSHRIVPNYAAVGDQVTAADLVTNVLKQTPQPSYDAP